MRRNDETGPPEPWSLYIHEETWVSVSLTGEEDFELIGERDGFAPAPDGFVDAQHLLTAAVRASIPMSEGDPIAVDLRWDLSDARTQVSGTSGPLEGFTWGQRGRDGWLVQNWLAISAGDGHSKDWLAPWAASTLETCIYRPSGQPCSSSGGQPSRSSSIKRESAAFKRDGACRPRCCRRHPWRPEQRSATPDEHGPKGTWAPRSKSCTLLAVLHKRCTPRRAKLSS